ncbi:hypothetical protein CAPTEDRAFT_206118 [Capitella teleta]|uniref:EGF-like domain-containing protein n=1 Tax=Capitella teleta TaxID=283909 RepID=R7UR08_CAPTE|nr:hypothetical protein CAPTEDRAFT_206118 [Capitella teleta]|eukprot:ELU05861.1 hypothetical protein CAPTEDRAFT_206118 [Capitella teleta]
MLYFAVLIVIAATLVTGQEDGSDTKQLLRDLEELIDEKRSSDAKDKCNPNPCENNGACSTAEDPFGWGFTCFCKAPSGGRLCEFSQYITFSCFKTSKAFDLIVYFLFVKGDPCEKERPCDPGQKCYRSFAAVDGRFCY